MHNRYVNPLCARYASAQMQEIFSDQHKFSTWRRLWVALARTQQELGLEISDAQIEAMEAHVEDIDYALAQQKEKELRHDVMAHIHTFGECVPEAKGIIHLGATSCYVGDNTDLLIQREALLRVRKYLLRTIEALAHFAKEHKDLRCLAFTHFQPAQPTTLGKRAALWMHDLVMDLEQLDFVLGNLKFRGGRGTTGTGASFLELFEGDHDKVKALEKGIAEKMGFDACYPVSGQTYSRKVDSFTLNVLSGIAQSAHKFSNDIRLLSHLREVEEPFEQDQVGSSAMAYKRNPMRSERIGALSRFVIVDALNPALTASEQWFERTLDDSANRRLSIPEAFLAIDGILQLYINIVKGMKVYPQVIERRLMEELPFMATENILMHCVKKGGDRQELHEAIRQHAVRAAEQIKLEGKKNPLLELIVQDARFNLSKEELENILKEGRFEGRAPEQTEEYLEEVQPILANNHALLQEEDDVQVRV